jgi:hypothetical protein
MSFGALVSHAAYALLLMNFVILHRWPVVAAAGSAVATLMHFVTARGALFNNSKPFA